MASLDDVAVSIGRLQGTVDEGFARLDGRIDAVERSVSGSNGGGGLVGRVGDIEQECAARKAAHEAGDKARADVTEARRTGWGLGLKIGLGAGLLLAGAGGVELVKAVVTALAR